jgi:hypothetical protein
MSGMAQSALDEKVRKISWRGAHSSKKEIIAVFYGKKLPREYFFD